MTNGHWALIIQITVINAFNRINVVTRQPSGDWTGTVQQ
jgi:hypothetical protein